jgi:hypothetical protein
VEWKTSFFVFIAFLSQKQNKKFLSGKVTSNQWGASVLLAKI